MHLGTHELVGQSVHRLRVVLRIPASFHLWPKSKFDPVYPKGRLFPRAYLCLSASFNLHQISAAPMGSSWNPRGLLYTMLAVDLRENGFEHALPTPQPSESSNPLRGWRFAYETARIISGESESRCWG